MRRLMCMKVVRDRVDHIDEELSGAMEYAEMYVVYKETKPQWAQKYYEMASQELQHAENLRAIAQDVMNSIAYIPESDDELWKDKQKQHAEKKAMVKLLLSK